jgi:hypothetical protein
MRTVLSRCLGVCGLCVLVFCHAHAATILVEPDLLPQGTNIRNAFPGVTLSVQGKPNSEVFAVSDYFNAHATTGSLVFGQIPEPSISVPKGWDENLGLLRAEFSSPANYVQIDLIFDDDDIASLWAFSSGGDLLAAFTAAGDGRNPVRFATANITRPGFDIAYVLAGGNVAEAVLLDNLQVRVSDVPEPNTLALLVLSVGLVSFAASRRRIVCGCLA